MTDNSMYNQDQAEDYRDFEALCTRCGLCCGSDDGDPCVHLKLDTQSVSYYCDDYAGRLGPQMTISGARFQCVPIVENIKRGSYHQKCAYRKHYK